MNSEFDPTFQVLVSKPSAHPARAREIVVLANPDLIDKLRVAVYPSIPSRLSWLRFSLPSGAARRFSSRSSLSAIFDVLQRSAKRPKLTPADQLLRAWLCAVWNDWKAGVFIVKAATVIGWHWKGFRLFWDWKVRHGKPGRPSMPKEVRQLIRTMSRENPLWGAPRIHGELLKLGINVGETSVKYIVRRRTPAFTDLETR